MSRDVDEALDRLERGIAEEQTAPILQAARALRGRLRTLLDGVRLEVEDPLLAKRRRLHHRLEVLEAKARAGRFEDAEEDGEAVASLARTLAAELEAREPAEDEARLPTGLRRFLLVAAREVRGLLFDARGYTVAGLSLLVFAWALTSTGLGIGKLADVWRDAMGPMLLLSPLAGVLLGVGRLDEDAREGRLHLVTGSGGSRPGLVAAKATGTLASLALALLGPAVLVAAIGLAFGTDLGTLSASLAFLAGVLLAATSFAAIAVLIEALGRGASVSLAGTLGAFLLLGPVWRAAFVSGSAQADARGELGATLVYHASPVAAARWVLDTGLQGAPSRALAGLAVLAAWTFVPVLAAGLLVQRRGLENHVRA